MFVITAVSVAVIMRDAHRLGIQPECGDSAAAAQALCSLSLCTGPVELGLAWLTTAAGDPAGQYRPVQTMNCHDLPAGLPAWRT
jgi:hypothetical protein